MASTQGMSTNQSDHFTVIESHTTKNITNMSNRGFGAAFGVVEGNIGCMLMDVLEGVRVVVWVKADLCQHQASDHQQR